MCKYRVFLETKPAANCFTHSARNVRNDERCLRRLVSRVTIQTHTHIYRPSPSASISCRFRCEPVYRRGSSKGQEPATCCNSTCGMGSFCESFAVALFSWCFGLVGDKLGRNASLVTLGDVKNVRHCLAKDIWTETNKEYVILLLHNNNIATATVIELEQKLIYYIMQ